MKKKGWWNCCRLKESKEIWQLNTVYAPWLDPRLGKRKDTIDLTAKIWTGTID